mgnify:CR=1 FL=1
MRGVGTPVWYLLGMDEGHGFRKKENEIKGYSAVLAFLEAEAMEAAGLSVAMDRFGTTIGRFPGVTRALIIASHTDTVPHGGWLDGALGVIYALATGRTVDNDGRRAAAKPSAAAEVSTGSAPPDGNDEGDDAWVLLALIRAGRTPR